MEIIYFDLFHCMCNVEDRHSGLGLSTVNKIIKEWECYKDFIVNLSMANKAEDYKNLLFTDGEFH